MTSTRLTIAPLTSGVLFLTRQRCQRRASHDRIRGVIVSGVLVMTASEV
jgi:hypothetical protein